MEPPSTAWLCNMHMDAIDQWDQLGFWTNSSSSKNIANKYRSSSSIAAAIERLTKSPGSWEYYNYDASSSSPTINLHHSELHQSSTVNYGAVIKPKELLDHTKVFNSNSNAGGGGGSSSSAKRRKKEVDEVVVVGVLATKPPYHNKQQQQQQQLDHVVAERKRREKLSQIFIALSAIVPGPGRKKMDKASVLEDATKYLKQLEEKVKDLEEKQEAAKRRVESAVHVKKSQLLQATDDGKIYSSACDEMQSSSSDDNLRQAPEIKVRLSNKSVLVRIHCENRKGLLVKALSAIDQNLHLTVINTSVVPFAASSLDVTVMAQTEEGFSMTVKDLVKNLNLAIREFV